MLVKVICICLICYKRFLSPPEWRQAQGDTAVGSFWVLVNKAEQIVFFYDDGLRGRDVLINFIGDAELKSVMTDGYNAYVFIGDIHACPFLSGIDFFYKREHQYDAEVLTIALIIHGTKV